MSEMKQKPAAPTPPRLGRAQSVRWRLLTLFGVAMLIMLLVGGLGVAYFTFRTEQIAWQGRQREAARNAAETVTTFVRSVKDSLAVASLLDRDYLEAEPRVLRDLLLHNRALREVIRVDAAGSLSVGDYVDAPLLANLFTIRQSTWFIRAAAGETYFGDIQTAPDGKSYLIMAVPAPDGGVVAARLRADVLWSVVAGIRFGETGGAYVVDRDGRVVAHANPSVVLESTSIAGRPGMAALLEAPDTEWSGSYLNFEGVQVVGAAAPVPESEWVVVTELSRSEAFLVSNAALHRLGGGMLLFAIVVVWATERYLRQLILQPLDRLQVGAERIGSGDLAHRIEVTRQDEVGRVAAAFNWMTGELQNLYEEVAARTRQLERYSGYLEASAEVAHAAGAVLDVDRLVRQVVESIRERFGLYYVGLFLVDETGQRARLRAGTGEAGRAMLARGYQIRVGEGMIGWSIAHAQVRVALEADKDALRLATIELPDTRSEAALPMRSRGQVIGALTVQSDEPGAFGRDAIAVLQTVADQVGVAIDNALLFAQTQTALDAARRAYGDITRQAWMEMLSGRADWGYRYARQTVAPVSGTWHREMLRAAETGRSVEGDGEADGALAIPLKVREQVVGVLRLRKAGDSASPEAEAWTREEVATLEALVEQLGLALESGRLYQDTLRRATRERLTREVTDRMREVLDMETVLKTAAQEVRELLGLPEVVVRLVPRLAGGGGDGAERPEGQPAPEEAADA